ncbi:hypothetical protein CRU98_01910 [Arcobacter sp. CECT 8986]|uniref:hypothetical protein n=1 Tax=Arcobacter sp. CECT 8986 TaxID=2044507 RepID=UPI0010098E44|nr:hypothetical protein [Arcobacter sp. CECT 8986]RXK01228.1 hypothetical protein CRU98_01910 [Arcobacter sp. CECT 8986]
MFKVYIDNDENSSNIRKLLFDSINIYTHSNKEKVKIFNIEYYKWIEDKLYDIYNTFSKKKESNYFIKSISSTADGMYFRSLADRSFNLQKELKNFIKNISYEFTKNSCN